MDTSHQAPSTKAEVPLAVAAAIDGEALARAIAALGISHVIIVPDTNLKTAISALHAQPSLDMIYVCTEDEAMGLNAGLHIAGHKPMLLIQNNGLFACINTLKAIALDAEVPTFMLIGQYGRDVTKPVEQNRLRAVRLLEPTLATWGVPYFRLEGPGDLGNLERAWATSRHNNGPAAAIVGAPTN